MIMLKNYNPVIVFSFSKRECEEYALQMAQMSFNEENEKLRYNIEQSRLQTEEATRVRESMRVKFDKLQQDMIVASGQAASERSQWQKSCDLAVSASKLTVSSSSHVSSRLFALNGMVCTAVSNN